MKVVVTKDLNYPYTKGIKEGSIVDVIDLGGGLFKTDKGQLISKENTKSVTLDVNILLNITRKIDDSLNGMNLSPDQKSIILSSLKSILKDELK